MLWSFRYGLCVRPHQKPKRNYVAFKLRSNDVELVVSIIRFHFRSFSLPSIIRLFCFELCIVQQKNIGNRKHFREWKSSRGHLLFTLPEIGVSSLASAFYIIQWINLFFLWIQSENPARNGRNLNKLLQFLTQYELFTSCCFPNKFLMLILNPLFRVWMETI